jgi:hypothetical protein
MIYAKVQSLTTMQARTTLLRKRLLALFVFICMSVNGFAPSAAQVSKHSLVMVLATAGQNCVVSLFSKCNESLVSITNKVSEYLRDFLYKNAVDSSMGEKKQDNSSDDNASSDNTIVIKAAAIGEYRKIIAGVKDTIYNVIVYSGKLFELYSNFKIPDDVGGAVPITVLFLTFIAGIRQRKSGDVAASLIFSYIGRKTRISA